jgi:uncharacterized membrane protein YeaQ/YmgE (transglycosylase-associated protein family)
MKCLKPFILITVIISFCLGNEFFNGYSLNQNLISESLPSKPIPRKATAGIIFAEYCGGFAGSLVVGTIGWVGGILLSSAYKSDSEDLMFPFPITKKQFFAGLTGGIICGTLGCATGTYAVGSLFDQRGTFASSLLGSVIGWFIPIGGPPAGSVVFYNTSRPKIQEQGFLYKHFDSPSFSFRAEKTKENKIIPVLDLKLVNARF